MKLQPLPQIKSPSRKTSKNTEMPLNTHHFSSLLKKFKLKKIQNPNSPTDPNLVQDDDDKNIEQQLEIKKANIENQKFLVKIYESNYSSIYDKIKQDYDESSKSQFANTKSFDSSK